jgi:hypothetical protein
MSRNVAKISINSYAKNYITIGAFKKEKSNKGIKTESLFGTTAWL